MGFCGVAGTRHPQLLLGRVRDQADSPRLNPGSVLPSHSCLLTLSFLSGLPSTREALSTLRTQFTVFSSSSSVCCVMSGLPGRDPQCCCHQPQHKVPQQLGLRSQALVDGVNALSANTGHRVNAGSLSFPAAVTKLIATGIHLGSEAAILIWIMMLD